MKAYGVDKDMVRDRDENSTSEFECIRPRYLVVYVSAANKNIFFKKTAVLVFSFRIYTRVVCLVRMAITGFNNDAHVSSCHPKPDETF